MTRKVYEVKVGQNFTAEIDVPGSKSVANRALIIAALAEGTTVLKNMLFSDDTRYMMEAIRKLGNTVEVDMHHMSDVAQTLSVVALFADGITILY